jgi:hypothetical protein
VITKIYFAKMRKTVKKLILIEIILKNENCTKEKMDL